MHIYVAGSFLYHVANGRVGQITPKLLDFAILWAELHVKRGSNVSGVAWLLACLLACWLACVKPVLGWRKQAPVPLGTPPKPRFLTFGTILLYSMKVVPNSRRGGGVALLYLLDQWKEQDVYSFPFEDIIQSDGAYSVLLVETLWREGHYSSLLYTRVPTLKVEGSDTTLFYFIKGVPILKGGMVVRHIPRT